MLTNPMLLCIDLLLIFVQVDLSFVYIDISLSLYILFYVSVDTCLCVVTHCLFLRVDPAFVFSVNLPLFFVCWPIPGRSVLSCPLCFCVTYLLSPVGQQLCENQLGEMWSLLCVQNLWVHLVCVLRYPMSLVLIYPFCLCSVPCLYLLVHGLYVCFIPCLCV